MLSTFLAVLRRDLLLAWRGRADVLVTLAFFIIVVCLFPFGVGAEPNQLRAIAPGVVWVTALLASLLALPRLFEHDLRDGTLELAYWPQLDHTPGAQPLVYPLVGDVASFKLEYLTRDGNWRESWPIFGEDAIPRAVRLTLTLADGARIDRWFTLR